MSMRGRSAVAARLLPQLNGAVAVDDFKSAALTGTRASTACFQSCCGSSFPMERAVELPRPSRACAPSHDNFAANGRPVYRSVVADGALCVKCRCVADRLRLGDAVDVEDFTSAAV